MSIKLRIKDILVCTALFVITLSGASGVINSGYKSTLEYVGYAILLPTIIFSSYHNERPVWVVQKTLLFCVMITLMSFGFLVQALSIKRKIILLFTVFGVCSVTTLSDNLLNSLKLIRASAYSILFAVCVSSVIIIWSGGKIWESIEVPGGGIMGITFALTGGIKYKNYFSGDMLAVFIGIFLYYIQEKKKLDLIVLCLTAIAIVLSNSRGSILLLASFLLVAFCYNIVRFIKPSQRNIFLGCLLVASVVGVIYAFDPVIMNIETFAMRFRGLLNYISYFKDDCNHMLLGSSELMYDKAEDYVITVRSMTGLDGSVENAWLNIMIKSGLLGVVAYIILFIRLFRLSTNYKDWHIKSSIVAITVMLLASSFVEAYIQSIHCILGIYCYLIILGFYGMSLDPKV